MEDTSKSKWDELVVAIGITATEMRKVMVLY